MLSCRHIENFNLAVDILKILISVAFVAMPPLKV